VKNGNTAVVRYLIAVLVFSSIDISYDWLDPLSHQIAAGS